MEKKYLEKNDAIWCNTYEDALKVLKIAHTLGYKWDNGESFLKVNNWKVYGNSTVYFISQGIYSSLEKSAMYYNVISARLFLSEYRHILCPEKLTKSDLKGSIEDFPLEVVQRMIECQVEQGNKPDVTVFQKSVSATRSDGGFTWRHSREGENFWRDAISLKKFDTFFSLYPKKSVSKEKSNKVIITIKKHKSLKLNFNL